MNGIHDLGGMDGFGPINPEPDDAPKFRFEWEKKVFSYFFLLLAAGKFNIDQFRHAIERLGNLHYLEGSYYEHWLGCYQILLDENGTVPREKLEARMAELAKEAS